MITWVIFLAVGILIGIGVGIYMSRLDDEAKRTQNSLNQQLQDKDKEMAAYKEQVNKHFVTTATLVNNMTESYRSVHEHLANGVNNLCKDGVDVNSIPFDNKTMIAQESAAIAQSEQLPEMTTITENATTESIPPEPSVDHKSAIEASSSPELSDHLDSKDADADRNAETALQESKAVEPEPGETIELSESDQAASSENSDTSPEAKGEISELDNLSAETTVADLEKSRVKASRMVH